jgi:hypothetical protein
MVVLRFRSLNRAAALALLTCAACQESLKVPANVQLSCSSDTDCPPSFSCGLAVGRCLPRGQTDRQGPSLLSASAAGETSVRLAFDEPLAADSASKTVGYAITPSLDVLAAALADDQQTVTLTTAVQTPGVTYTLSVTGVSDLYGNAVAEGARQQTFVGFGVPPDSAAPVILVPVQGARVRVGTLTVARARPR